jgi:hypothetical protein
VVPLPYEAGLRTAAEVGHGFEAFTAAYMQLKADTANQPVVRLIGYDSLEGLFARFPDALLSEVDYTVKRTRALGDLTVAVGRPGVSMMTKVLGMVDWHIKLSKMNDVLLLQGVKPHTNVYAVDCDSSRGYPVTSLSVLI